MRFADRDIESCWKAPATCHPRRVSPALRKALYRKLQMLDAAYTLTDLCAPPGNRLEQLQGDRLGQYSIRVNDRWRLCFLWENGEATEVEFCDYH